MNLSTVSASKGVDHQASTNDRLSKGAECLIETVPTFEVQSGTRNAASLADVQKKTAGGFFSRSSGRSTSPQRGNTFV